MQIKNCPKCGKVFAYINRNLCPNCLQREEEEFEIIREYIRRHPGSTVFSTAQETGIKEETILRFLREGRLEAGTTCFSDFTLTCEMCGKPVSTGKLCDPCAQKLRKGFEGKKEEVVPEKRESKTRMYTRDQIRNKR